MLQCAECSLHRGLEPERSTKLSADVCIFLFCHFTQQPNVKLGADTWAELMHPAIVLPSFV